MTEGALGINIANWILDVLMQQNRLELPGTLYGKFIALSIELQLDRIIRRRANSIHAARGDKGDTTPGERDILLITYADQVRKAGVPPLQMLATVLDKHLADVMSGVHLLPFLLYSSDFNYRNPDVLLKRLDVVLSYVERGTRIIRLGAVAYLWKEIGTSCIHLPQTRAIIQLVRVTLDEAAPWALLVTETNVPYEENVSYFGDGANEAQWVYNFALRPLVLHAFQTGDATRLSRWAQSLKAPSDDCTTSFNFLASHDGIGLNPARGIPSDIEIDTLVARTRQYGGLVSHKQNADGTSPYELSINFYDAFSNSWANETGEPRVNRFIAAQAIMLAMVGVPEIYIHSPFGSCGDRIGAEESGQPRRINRQKLLCVELERDLADPNSFRASILRRYAELIRARRSRHDFHPHARQHVLECGKRIFAFLRTVRDITKRVLCLHNVSDAAVMVKMNQQHPDDRWQELFEGKIFASDAQHTFAMEAQPYQVVWALER